MKRLTLIALLSIVCRQMSWADIITFADAGVKAVCVANWDTDGDGELSTDEAAAVTSLGTVFRGRTDIGSFPELRYFTGVTAIDEDAFRDSGIGPDLVIPGTVKKVCRYAFYNCKQLKRIVLEEGVETVGFHAFSGPIGYLSLPASLTFIYSQAIDPYVNGSSSSGIFLPEGDLYVHVHSAVPAEIDKYAFYDLLAGGHLIVPFGCAADYKAVWPWSQFREYIETGDVNRDGRVDVADLTLLIAYIGGREHTDMDALIADINGDGVLDGEDVSQLCQYLLGS